MRVTGDSGVSQLAMVIVFLAVVVVVVYLLVR